ncbi:hypothetical protein QFW77_05745, partial [Luteimonas sp. RD2P54]|nr:hypothetical protein [Luteimonas endophytica]
AVQRLISSSITALIRVSLERLHLSRKSLGHYMDTLNRLHDRLHAYGDLVFGVERIDLADGTLTMLGDAIFEVAEAASDLMDKVAGQALPDASRRRNHVREAPAVYGVPASPGLTRDAAMPMLPPPADAGWRPQAATRH